MFHGVIKKNNTGTVFLETRYIYIYIYIYIDGSGVVWGGSKVHRHISPPSAVHYQALNVTGYSAHWQHAASPARPAI